MTMLLQNRTISMILTVPHVKELISPLSYSTENLNEKSFSFSKNHAPPSIPVYHGSILCIEHHHDNPNTSDLIVRVPNFHHSSLPAVTISSIPRNDDQLSDTDSQRQGHTKRRAPICPIFNSSSNQPDVNSRKRLATGLRNFSRVFLANCKSKLSANLTEITIVPVLPDVEVITEDFDVPTSPKKMNKNPKSTSKFITQTFLFIKQKNFKIKRKRSSSTSKDMKNNNTNISLKDNEAKETIPIARNEEVEQQSTTIAQLIPNIPISSIDLESSSTHPYCTISGIPIDPRIGMTDNDTDNISSTNSLPKTMEIPFRYEDEPPSTINRAYPIQSLDRIDIEQTQYYDDNIEENVYVVHPNGDTFSECYEVTYEFDPQFQQFLDNKTEQLYLSEIEDESSIRIKIDVDPFKYEDLASAITPWCPIITQTDYEQFNRDNFIRQSDRTRRHQSEEKDTNLEYLQKPSIARVKFRSLEDLTPISNDQISTDQSDSVSFSSTSKELLCIDDTPTINEDYTVILQCIQLDAFDLDIDNT